MLKSPKLTTLDFQALQALAAKSTSKSCSKLDNKPDSKPGSNKIQACSADNACNPNCTCAASDSTGWISSPASLSDSDFEEVGTLLQDPFVEPTFEEFHPNGTRYDSPDAPIAPRYFPYNRCTVSICKNCGRAYLRYTEAGGYFVDRRIRALSLDRLVDAKLD